MLCCIFLSPAVALSYNHSYDLTDEKVDRYLQVMPDTSKVLKALEKRLRPDKELNEKVQAAVSQGKMHRTILEVAADSPELGELKSVVENADYDSLDAWAYTSRLLKKGHTNSLFPIFKGNFRYFGDLTASIYRF